MRKRNLKIGMMLTGAFCIAISTAFHLGYVNQWCTEIFLVIAFPAFVILLGLWWNAGEGEGDIPFIGY